MPANGIERWRREGEKENGKKIHRGNGIHVKDVNSTDRNELQFLIGCQSEQKKGRECEVWCVVWVLGIH